MSTRPIHHGDRPYDGIICFGGVDWWYHNRGHYDVQMMRRLSAHVPVLYVNSIGMRTPSPREGRMFLTRIGRKLASWGRGFVRVDDSFAVLSPPALPGPAGLAITAPLLARRVRRAARGLGLQRPLIWVACPTAAAVVDRLDPAAVVYQRTDRYECFHHVDESRICDLDRWLKARADLTVYCSTSLYERERADCHRACRIDHGVDLDHFVRSAGRPGPTDLASLPGPRIGFVGGVDAHTFDEELFRDTAARLPDHHFVLIGACSLPDGWCSRDNVTLLGQRPLEQVAAYMAACDVLIMPWRRSPWIEACNPVKLKEYLASGRPIVTTDFPELRAYEGLVRVADDPARFADAIRTAVREPGDAQQRRDAVRGQTWDHQAALLLDELTKIGAAGPVRTAVPRPARSRVKGAEGPSAAPVPIPAGAERTIDLSACILLAGGLRPSPLVAAAGMSVLDLWLTPDRTVLDLWLERLDDLAAELQQVIATRVVHNAVLPAPWPARGRPHLTIEQDPRSLRGPAGVVRDLCGDYEPDEHVLVAESARALGDDLRPLVAAHAGRGADVTVAMNPDGTPAGLYLVRCEALRLVPDAGFMDLKEQWLRRAVETGLSVYVHRVSAPALPLRTREQFLEAARAAAADPRELRIVCHGALIGPDAVVADSIIMPDATVAAGAMVVRSLLCPGTSVQRGEEIVDCIVYPGDRLGAVDAPSA